MIRVLIADDQRIVRDGLVTLVGLIDGVEVVGTASDGAEAVARAAEADVVLMDLNMPGTSGVEATRRLAGSPARVLVLTTYADDTSIFGALEAGARGYLTKDAGLEEIERALRAVAAGQTHLDPTVQARLVEAALGTGADTAEDDLTAREAEVLTLIADGLSNQEIAARLVVSLATVKTHVNRIFAKTGARDRAQAVRHAYRTGRVSRT